MPVIAFDTEYSARYQESGVAPLACMSFVSSDDAQNPKVVGPADARELWAEWLEDESIILAAHGASNDVIALTQSMDPSVTPGHGKWWAKAFGLYEADRVRCTLVRQALHYIRDGREKFGLGLGEVARDMLGLQLAGEKKAPAAALPLLKEGVPYPEWPAEVLAETPWRFKFETLAETPVSQWPASARAYVLEDASTPLWLYYAQMQRYQTERLGDEVARTRAAFDLHLLSIPGWRTDQDRVEMLMRIYQRIIEECRAVTVTHGLTEAKTVHKGKPNERTDYTAKKAVRQQLVFMLLEGDVKLTDTATDKGLDLKTATPEQALAYTCTDELQIKRAIAARGGRVVDFAEVFGAVEDNTLPQVLSDSGDAALNAYRTGERAKKRVSSFLVNYRTDKRVRSSYNPLVSSGRVSARGSKSSYAINIQQQPGGYDVPSQYTLRGCIIPDEDHILVGADWSQVELCALGHILSVFMRAKTNDDSYESTLSKAINAGIDCHSLIAAGLFDTTYERMLATASDPATKKKRKMAKPVNFGLPGGMGLWSFIEFALKSYDVQFTEAQARKAIRVWKETWSEVGYYQQEVGRLINLQGGTGTFVQLYSNRVRGGCHYTSGCNTYFQGLAADGAMETLRRIIDACYRLVQHILFRLRAKPIAFVHDEFVMTQPDPLLELEQTRALPKPERWKLYAQARAAIDAGRAAIVDRFIVDHAEEGMNALSDIMVEGMRAFIPDVAIRVEGQIFPDRWGK